MLGRPGPLRETVRADPDVGRAGAIGRTRIERAPDWAGPAAWVLLDAVDPPAAGAALAAIRANAVARLQREIFAVLSPLALWNALQIAWAARLEGDAGREQVLLTELAAQGVPLPYDP